MSALQLESTVTPTVYVLHLSPIVVHSLKTGLPLLLCLRSQSQSLIKAHSLKPYVTHDITLHTVSTDIVAVYNVCTSRK